MRPWWIPSLFVLAAVMVTTVARASVTPVVSEQLTSQSESGISIPVTQVLVLTAIRDAFVEGSQEDVPFVVEVAAGGGPCCHAASSLRSVSHGGVTVSACRASAVMS